VAIRCSITVLVPLFVLLAIGRLDLAVFASFGAFPSIYGRNVSHGARLHMQLRAGMLMFATLLGAIAAATLLASSPAAEGTMAEGTMAEWPMAEWSMAGVIALVAGITALVTQYWELRPGGSLFFVFAFGAVASMPTQPPIGEAVVTSIVVICWSLAMGMSSRLLGRRFWKPFGWPAGGVFRGDAAAVAYPLVALNVASAAVAGTAALLLSEPWGINHTYWAQLASVVPLAGHPTRLAVNRGLHRVIGTCGGLVIAALASLAHPPLWALILLIALFQGLTELVIVRSYVLGQLFVTPLALLSIELAMQGAGADVHAGALLYDRGLETVIGSAVGIVTVLLPWAVRKVSR
jgi:hypothetical protein